MAYVAQITSQSSLGRVQTRDTAIAAPSMYQPTITADAVLNKSGSNVNVTVKSDYPLPSSVDGLWKSPNRFLIRTSITALQSVTNATERAAILDAHIAFLTKHKAVLMAGGVPTSNL